MNNTPVIINYAATPVGRLMSKPGEAIEQFEQDILADLVIDSVNNAGIDKKDIGSLILTSPTPATRQLGFATFLASRLGLQCQGQISEVNNMGITGGLAFDQACNDVSNGKANFALALGIEYSTSASIVDMMDRGIRVVGDVHVMVDHENIFQERVFHKGRHGGELGFALHLAFERDIAHEAIAPGARNMDAAHGRAGDLHGFLDGGRPDQARQQQIVRMAHK